MALGICIDKGLYWKNTAWVMKKLFGCCWLRRYPVPILKVLFSAVSSSDLVFNPDCAVESVARHRKP
jgi:hypothetical protein